jgi:hypothetical protein
MAVSCLPITIPRSSAAAPLPAFLWILLGFLLPPVVAQDPLVDRLDGAALRPGQPAAVTSVGKQQQGSIALWTPAGTLRPKAGSDLTKDQPVAFEGSIAADAVPGIYPFGW